MRKHLFVSVFVLLAVTVVAQAANNPAITVNEFGVGTLLFPGGVPIAAPGVFLPDPGPGGLPAALTYNLLGPPALVAGDLLIQELIGATQILSDVIRFNPANTAPGYPASLVFYSDNGEGVDALADTGLPTAFYTNTFSILEVGTEGDNGVTYTPTENQPGFVPGFSVTYRIISDSAVPEPSSASLVVLASGLALAARRWLKARAS